MQTTVYYRGQFYMFVSERTRHDIVAAENDGVILFLRQFFPYQTMTWLYGQRHRSDLDITLEELEELYYVVDEAVTAARDENHDDEYDSPPHTVDYNDDWWDYLANDD